MRYLGMTDHNNLFSWFDFYANWGENATILPIYGIELNVEKNHITALALNNEGLKNLSILNNLGQQKGKNKISEMELFSHSQGVFILSGCSRGIVPQLVNQEKKKEAEEKIYFYKENIENYGLEVQNYGGEFAKKNIRILFEYSKKYNLPLVPTNDVHYLNQSDYHCQSLYVSMKTQGKVQQLNSENFFKTKEEMNEFFSEPFLNQTLKITSRVDTNFKDYVEELKGEKKIPISMIYYYDEIEALRKVFYGQKKYRLAEHLVKEMNKKDWTLSDLSIYWGNIKKEIALAKSMVGKIIKIEPDPYHYIYGSDLLPIYKKNIKKQISTQFDIFTAEKIGFEIADCRKQVYAFSNAIQ